ncbi:MAG: ornithine cyclodeaminase family domain, partial [Thermoleophilia bacterium]
MAERPYEDVRIEGHLIDSLMVPQIMDDVMDLEGEFEILSFDVGRTKTESSRAVFRIYGRDRAHLEELLTAVQEHGAVAVAPEDATLAPAPADGVFPDEFYSTTNLETYVRLDGEWVRVEQPEMDCGVRVRPGRPGGGSRAETLPLSDVTKGELFVVGHHGIRVVPLERPRESQPFEFMGSAVSSEKPKAQIVREVARLLRRVRDEGKLTIAVVGPAVVHTGSGAQLARLIRAGYIGALFGGNAVATHDIESALFGTSLGIDMKTGMPVPGGHEHHLRAINTIRRCGGIAAAVEQGVLGGGLMHTLATTGTPFVLAGSIRDDGPLPEVITDV